MAGKTPQRQSREKPRLGNLSPQYEFFLNPYRDVRFTTSCPGCSGKIKQKKLPLAIHIGDWGMIILNKTCRFCPRCDLLIAHRDEIETLLSQVLPSDASHTIGKDILIVGTVERKEWRRGLTKPLTGPEMLDALHDFKDYVQFEPPRWEYTGGGSNPAKPRQ